MRVVRFEKDVLDADNVAQAAERVRVVEHAEPEVPFESSPGVSSVSCQMPSKEREYSAWSVRSSQANPADTAFAEADSMSGNLGIFAKIHSVAG